MAHAGKLDGAMVINDTGLANRLAQAGVPYVAFRPVSGVGNNHAAPYGDRRDIERGAAEWQNGWNRQAHAFLDPRVYIQLFGHNEQNYLNDGYWYVGVQQGAPAGRKVLLFGDGVGHPRDQRRGATGKAISEAWSLRVESGCMRIGKQRGDLACVHGYGRLEPVRDPQGNIVGMKETDDPGSAIWSDGRRDDEAFAWFGGRHQMVWRDIIPADSRMNIFIGECGPSDAIYRGSGALISDMKGYLQRFKADPYVVAFAYWTIGRGGGDPGDFAYSAFDTALPDVLNWLRSLETIITAPVIRPGSY